MDRQRISAALEGLRRYALRYRYAVAAVLLGALLMALPGGEGRQPAPAEPQAPGGVQAEMEAVLSDFDGVGALRLMLTAEPGTERWAGAVIVCEGAESPSVRLELTRAVSALTGLPSDRISIVKGRPKQ